MDVKYHDLFRGLTLVKASASKNSTNRSIGGTVILLSPNSSLSNIERINSFTIATKCYGNPITTVISCYIPINVSDDDDVTNFYKELSIYIRSLPKHNIFIRAGDFNAHILPHYFNRFTYHDLTN